MKQTKNYGKIQVNDHVYTLSTRHLDDIIQLLDNNNYIIKQKLTKKAKLELEIRQRQPGYGEIELE